MFAVLSRTLFYQSDLDNKNSFAVLSRRRYTVEDDLLNNRFTDCLQ